MSGPSSSQARKEHNSNTSSGAFLGSEWHLSGTPRRVHDSYEVRKYTRHTSAQDKGPLLVFIQSPHQCNHKTTQPLPVLQCAAEENQMQTMTSGPECSQWTKTSEIDSYQTLGTQPATTINHTTHTTQTTPDTNNNTVALSEPVSSSSRQFSRTTTGSASVPEPPPLMTKRAAPPPWNLGPNKSDSALLSTARSIHVVTICPSNTNQHNPSYNKQATENVDQKTLTNRLLEDICKNEPTAEVRVQIICSCPGKNNNNHITDLASCRSAESISEQSTNVESGKFVPARSVVSSDKSQNTHLTACPSSSCESSLSRFANVPPAGEQMTNKQVLHITPEMIRALPEKSIVPSVCTSSATLYQRVHRDSDGHTVCDMDSSCALLVSSPAASKSEVTETQTARWIGADSPPSVSISVWDQLATTKTVLRATSNCGCFGKEIRMLALHSPILPDTSLQTERRNLQTFQNPISAPLLLVHKRLIQYHQLSPPQSVLVLPPPVVLPCTLMVYCSQPNFTCEYIDSKTKATQIRSYGGDNQKDETENGVERVHMNSVSIQANLP